MTAPSWSVDNLLARVKRKCLIQTANAKLTDAEMVEIIDEELQGVLYPIALKPRDDAHTDWYFTFIGPSTGPYVNFFELGRWVSGRNIVAVYTFVDVTVNPEIRRLRRVDPSDLTRKHQFTSGSPDVYALMGNRVMVEPMNQLGGAFLVQFEMRPNRLCLTTSDDVAEITNWNSTTSVATVSPPVSYNVVNGSLVDVVRGTPGFGVRGLSMPVTAAASPAFTLGVNDPPNVGPDMTYAASGDWLCASGWTPVFPLVDLFFPAAVYIGAAGVCREIGDLEQAAINTDLGVERATLAMETMTNRARKDPPILINPYSPLRTGPWNGNRWAWGD